MSSEFEKWLEDRTFNSYDNSESIVTAQFILSKAEEWCEKNSGNEYGCDAKDLSFYLHELINGKGDL